MSLNEFNSRSVQVALVLMLAAAKQTHRCLLIHPERGPTPRQGGAQSCPAACAPICAQRRAAEEGESGQRGGSGARVPTATAPWMLSVLFAARAEQVLQALLCAGLVNLDQLTPDAFRSVEGLAAQGRDDGGVDAGQ